MKLKFGVLAFLPSFLVSFNLKAQVTELPCICELMASLEIVPETPKQKIIIAKKPEEDKISWSYEELYALRNPSDETSETVEEIVNPPRRPINLEDRPRSKAKKIRVRKRVKSPKRYFGQCPTFR